MKARINPNQVTFALVAIYLIALYWIIVLKFNITAYHDRIEGSVNWIPFREAVLYQSKMDMNEILLNIFIFVPLGLFVGILLEKWSLGKKLVFFFSISFLLEVSQFILQVGAFDITDLINNSMGGLLGLMIFRGLESGLRNRQKAQKIINFLALVGTVVVFSFLLFLKLNNLWIFRMQLL